MNEKKSECQPVRGVHVKGVHSGPANLSAANECGTRPREVPCPLLCPRVEQSHDIATHRVYTRQIWPLGLIASVATPSQVFQVVRTAVLFGDDVFKVESEERLVILVHQTVFAAGLSP